MCCWINWVEVIVNKGHFTHEPRALAISLWGPLTLIQRPYKLSNALEFDTVYWNLHQAYLLEVDLTLTYGISWNIIHSLPWIFIQLWRLFIHDKSFGPLGLHLLVWIELGQSQPFDQPKFPDCSIEKLATSTNTRPESEKYLNLWLLRLVLEYNLSGLSLKYCFKKNRDTVWYCQVWVPMLFHDVNG